MDENWMGLPPREKLLKCGAQTLSDVELLAIFLRIGTRGVHVMTLAQRLLDVFGSLHQLMTAPAEDFQAIHGIGMAKYAQLNAVAELARRCFTCQQALENRVVSSAEQMLDFLNSSLAHRKGRFSRWSFLIISIGSFIPVKCSVARSTALKCTPVRLYAKR
ncbi:hypothetical protein ERHA55_50690 [Erwinia rhapontici]|nr:hypothetical protein ERHA55_50690 [Erwinia rhapontici]